MEYFIKIPAILYSVLFLYSLWTAPTCPSSWAFLKEASGHMDEPDP